MKIKGTRFFITPTARGYECMTRGDALSRQELREYINYELARARRLFGTAVAHWSESCLYPDRYIVKITARRDPRSALWSHYTIDAHG